LSGIRVTSGSGRGRPVASSGVSPPDGPDTEIEAVLLLEDTFPDLGTVRIYRTRRARPILHVLRGASFIDRTGVLTDLEDVGGWLGSMGGAKAAMERLG